MVQSVLGSLVLAYRPLWNRARTLAGIELSVQGNAQTPVDTPHLLRTLSETWNATSPPLLLAPWDRQLLCDMLEHAPTSTPWIAVRDAWLAEPEIRTRVEDAHRRGLRLVWRGTLGALPEPDVAACFSNSLLSLSAETAGAALQADAYLRDVRGMGAKTAHATQRASPLIDGQMYENLPSRALATLCLNQHRAVAVAGWPEEDVLYSLRHVPVQPSRAVIFRLLKAIDAEQSLETFEDILSEDAVLAYRFMIYTNAAALGLRTGIDSLRRGLVMMGYSSLKKWLSDQLPVASTEPDLEPVRVGAVIRARLSDHLLEAGIQNDLRREVYLCGLLLNLGDLLGEPLGHALRRVPLSERIYDATVLRTGPYAAALDMALAFEGGNCEAVRTCIDKHEMDPEEANRALLRVLSATDVTQV